MLKLGNQGVAAMYLGGRKITKAYLGEALVFGASAPPEPVRYTVTLSVDPQGGGTASGGGSVEAGAQVTVTASASSGYTFSGWRENGSIVSTSASYTFTVTGDRSLTAVFAAVIPTYRVTAGIDPEGSGTASGGGTYQQGTSVTVTAAPGEGYRFVKWTENGQTVSESESYTFTVTGDRTLTAVFEAEKTSRLPAGYTEVEWIQNGFWDIPSNNAIYSSSAFHMVFSLERIPTSSGYSAILGLCRYVDYSTWHHTLSINKNYLYNSSTTMNTSISEINADTKYNLSVQQISYAGIEITLNDLKKSGSASLNFMIKNGFGIFKERIYNSKASAFSAFSYGILYSLKLFDDNGNVTVSLVPCIDPNSKIGLYDIVQDVFYEGTGLNITAGPAV